MPYRNAKDDYSKDEIIEILRRNVALYKDEKEFVDYIVNLSMYLMDRHYDMDRKPLLTPKKRVETPPLPPTSKLSAPPPPPAKPEIREDELAPPRAEDLRRRHTYDIDPPEEYLQNAPPPFSSSGSAPPMPPPPPAPPQAHMPADRRPAEFDDLDEDFQAPQDPRTSRDVYQVAGGLNTPPEGIIAPRLNMKKREEPEPEDPNKDDDPRIKQVKVENLGRTRVYRVVRSYKSQTSAETPCQVCGSLVPPDAKRCPTCGHVL